MAVKQRSNKYWARRAEEGLNKALKTSASYERLINRVYTEASINLTQELQRLYRNAYKGDKSFDMDKLNALEPSGNVERFKAAMQRQGLYRELPDNYKGRLTRLEMLDAQIWAEVKRAGQKETAYNTDAYRKIVNNGYKNAQSVIAKGTNTSFTFNKLNTGAVNTILNNQFDGANYSERIWGQTDVLANELQQKLATAVATGQNYERTAREFRQRFNVKKTYAERLIRTESCYFETEAKLQAYKDLGITELVFVATLDSRTSEICQHADGERIKISEAVVGENIPPLHPNCRSTVRAYIAEEFEPEERIERIRGKNSYTDNQTYEEWKTSRVKSLINVIGGKLDLKSMQVIANGIKYDADSMFDLDPVLLGGMQNSAEGVINSYGLEAWLKQNGNLNFYSQPMYGGVIASTNRKRPHIGVNSSYYVDNKKLVRAVRNGVNKHHFMPAKRYRDYTINHELGHLVENYILANHNTDAHAAVIIKEVFDMVVKDTGLTASKAWQQHMSGYGKIKAREAFAESFANMRGGAINPFGRALKKWLSDESNLRRDWDAYDKSKGAIIKARKRGK